jgi:hypothetical protein
MFIKAPSTVFFSPAGVKRSGQLTNSPWSVVKGYVDDKKVLAK